VDIQLAVTASFSGFRSIQLAGAEAEAHAYNKALKMYPSSEAPNPKPTLFVDGRANPLHTRSFYDMRALQDGREVTDEGKLQAALIGGAATRRADGTSISTRPAAAA
jgi:hypothetical protein